MLKVKIESQYSVYYARVVGGRLLVSASNLEEAVRGEERSVGCSRCLRSAPGVV